MSRLLTYSIFQQKRYILDTYSDAAVAYSLRKLLLSYSGYCIKVRRSSDDTTQDIGFSAGRLDTTSLLTFCGAGNGFIDTWYDQSGNSRHLSQSAKANQPQIVSSGSVLLLNGLPCLYFNSANVCFLWVNVAPLSNLIGTNYENAVFVVFNQLNGNTNSSILSTDVNTPLFRITGNIYNGGDRLQYFFPVGVGSRLLEPVCKLSNFYTQCLVSGYTNGTVSEVDINDNVLATGSPSGTPSLSGTAKLVMGKNHVGYSTISFNGNIQEAIVYKKDMNSSVSKIKSKIYEFYSIRASIDTSYLLDLAPSAYAAFSLRKLKSNYPGYCIKVRRSSDNTTQDIGFVSDVLDTTSLLTFCGAGDGFINTWYDQTGGWDATQSNTSLQPQIVSSGSVITNNGKPAITYKTGGADNLVISTRADEIRSIFFVVNPYVGWLLGDKQYYDFAAAAATTGYFEPASSAYIRNGKLYRNGIEITRQTTPRTNAQQVLSLFTTGNVRSNYISQDRSIGGRSYAGTGVVQEIIIYYDDKSSLRSEIESNINDFYSIY